MLHPDREHFKNSGLAAPDGEQTPLVVESHPRPATSVDRQPPELVDLTQIGVEQTQRPIVVEVKDVSVAVGGDGHLLQSGSANQRHAETLQHRWLSDGGEDAREVRVPPSPDARPADGSERVGHRDAIQPVVSLSARSQDRRRADVCRRVEVLDRTTCAEERRRTVDAAATSPAVDDASKRRCIADHLQLADAGRVEVADDVAKYAVGTVVVAEVLAAYAHVETAAASLDEDDATGDRRRLDAVQTDGAQIEEVQSAGGAVEGRDAGHADAVRVAAADVDVGAEKGDRVASDDDVETVDLDGNWNLVAATVI